MARLPWRDDPAAQALEARAAKDRADIHQLEARTLALETKKDRSLQVAWVGVAGVLAAAIISGGVALYTDDDPAPPPAPVVQCIEERQQAKELYLSDGYWTSLPEGSEIEKQCNINTYVVADPPDRKE